MFFSSYGLCMHLHVFELYFLKKEKFIQTTNTTRVRRSIFCIQLMSQEIMIKHFKNLSTDH